MSRLRPGFPWFRLAPSGGGGAPSDAQFVVINADATLTNERTLVAGGGLTLTDGGANSTVTVALDTTSSRNVDHTAVVLTAGAGLTGGGDISASRTFAVGAGTGITVNADDVAVNQATAFAWTAAHTHTVAGLVKTLTNSADAASSQVTIFQGDRATVAANDEAYISLRLSDSAGNQDEFGRITWRGTTITSASEAGRLAFSVINAGALAEELYLTPTGLTPAADDGLALGVSGTAFADLFLALGAVINFNAGDVTITHSANTLAFAGVTGGYTFDDNIVLANDQSYSGRDTNSTIVNTLLGLNSANDAHFLADVGNGNIADTAQGGFNSDVPFTFGGACCGGGLPTSITFNTSGTHVFQINNTSEVTIATDTIRPSSNDGAALGVSGTAWSDLFLASGAVINFVAGNVTLTHATGELSTNTMNLKIGGTAARATTAGTNQLVLFNGTIPAGTLTNGVSIYSEAGELKVMDAGGTATQLSPHDPKTGEWIFNSKDTKTGKVLRIDMERLMRKLDDMFGGGFIKEYVEEI